MVSYKSSTKEEQLSEQNTRLICKKTKKMIHNSYVLGRNVSMKDPISCEPGGRRC